VRFEILPTAQAREFGICCSLLIRVRKVIVQRITVIKHWVNNRAADGKVNN